MLIRHSKYSIILSKIHSTDCFFGDFAHWEIFNIQKLPALHPTLPQNQTFRFIR